MGHPGGLQAQPVQRRPVPHGHQDAVGLEDTATALQYHPPDAAAGLDPFHAGAGEDGHALGPQQGGQGVADLRVLALEDGG